MLTVLNSAVQQRETEAGKPVGRSLSVGFRLTRGADDDLIKWLLAIPERERSRAIRDRLRGNAPNGENNLDAIRGDLAELRELIMRGSFAPDVAGESAVNAGPRLSTEEVAARAAKMKKAKW